MFTIRQLPIRAAAVVTILSSWLFPPRAVEAVQLEWVNIGNPGNPADPLTGKGSVPYEYRISSTEITNAQFAEYLNTVDPNADQGLGYQGNMCTVAVGGICRNLALPVGSRFVTRPNMADKPANMVTFMAAMRFVNWLNNNQIAGGTENGAYVVNNGFTETRAPGATYFLPSENEWYKSAYYDPTAGAGGGDNYWLYPTRSNTLPIMATATLTGDIANPGPNVANFFNAADWNGQNGNVTTVASAGPLSTSYYGTFDQGGNIGEWTERLFTGPGPVARVLIGGWYSNSGSLMASTGSFGVGQPTEVYFNAGFRVASVVPEPATAGLLLAGAAVLKRRRASH